MILKEVCTALEACVLTADDRFENEIECVYASDLMSDVLALATSDSLLITSATNIHVVRTAEVAELSAVCFLRGKKPDEETLELASSKGLPTMSSPLTMFEACGRLYGKLSACEVEK